MRLFGSGCGPCLGLTRTLHAARLGRAHGLRIRHGVTVASLAPHADGAFVRFSEGAVETYDFVAGADGIRSSIRCLMFGDTPRRYCGQMGWWVRPASAWLNHQDDLSGPGLQT